MSLLSSSLRTSQYIGRRNLSLRDRIESGRDAPLRHPRPPERRENDGGGLDRLGHRPRRKVHGLEVRPWRMNPNPWSFRQQKTHTLCHRTTEGTVFRSEPRDVSPLPILSPRTPVLRFPEGRCWRGSKDEGLERGEGGSLRRHPLPGLPSPRSSGSWCDDDDRDPLE